MLPTWRKIGFLSSLDTHLYCMQWICRNNRHFHQVMSQTAGTDQFWMLGGADDACIYFSVECSNAFLPCLASNASSLFSPKICIANLQHKIKLDKTLGERRSWPRQIITPTSVLINQICSNLTICIKEYWASPKDSGSIPSPWSGQAATVIEFFAHCLIWEDADRHQNLISSFYYHLRPLRKIS